MFFKSINPFIMIHFDLMMIFHTLSLDNFLADYMKEVVKLLLDDNLQATEGHLPTHLEEIREIAGEV